MKKSNNIWVAILSAFVVLGLMVGFFFLGYFSSAKGWIEIKESAPAEEELPEGETGEENDENDETDPDAAVAKVAAYTTATKSAISTLKVDIPGGGASTSWICTECGEGTVTRTFYKPASCGETGLSIYECDNCDYRLEETEEALQHSVTSLSFPATEMYCPDTKFTCQNCGMTYYASTGTTARRAHKYTMVAQQAATCTTEGYTKYECDECGYERTDTEPMTGHTPNEGKITKYPTCTETGVMTYTCTVCGAVVKTEVIPAKGHTYPETGIETKPATCTEQGIMTFYCTVCGEGTYTEPIDKIGHDFEVVEAVEPTCTEPGHGQYMQCTRCDFISGEVVEIPALNHSWTEWEETRESCDVAGERTRTCTRCGEKETEILAAGTHSWDDGVATKPATCIESGILTKTCTLCGETTEETIEATGHKPTKLAAVDPTCTTTGLTEGERCSACDVVFQAQQVIPAKGHDMTYHPAVAATETAGGNVEYWQCKTCASCFADAEGKTQLAAEDTLIPPIGMEDEDSSEEGGLAWWGWALIVGGVVLAIGITLVVVDQLKAKNDKTKKSAKASNSSRSSKARK